MKQPLATILFLYYKLSVVTHCGKTPSKRMSQPVYDQDKRLGRRTPPLKTNSLSNIFPKEIKRKSEQALFQTIS